MVDVGAVAVGIPVGNLTFEPSLHTLPDDFPFDRFPESSFQPGASGGNNSTPESSFAHNSPPANFYSVELAPTQISPNTFVTDGFAQAAPVYAPDNLAQVRFSEERPVETPVQELPLPQSGISEQFPAAAPASLPPIGPEYDGGMKNFTSRSYNELGYTTCQAIDSDKVLLFEIEKFPVSDAGACQLALVVLAHLKSLHLHASKPIVVHIRSVDHSYVANYSGKQLPEHEYYPCALLDQALPICTRFKVVSGDAEFSSALKARGYDAFIADSVDQAMLADRFSWPEANSTGPEFSSLPTYEGMLNGGIEALEDRYARAIRSAKHFTPPVPVQVPQPVYNHMDTRPVPAAL